eukprot:5542824-Pleurochrysis_carterae.AAC.1
MRCAASVPSVSRTRKRLAGTHSTSLADLAGAAPSSHEASVSDRRHPSSYQVTSVIVKLMIRAQARAARRGASRQRCARRRARLSTRAAVDGRISKRVVREELQAKAGCSKQQGCCTAGGRITHGQLRGWGGGAPPLGQGRFLAVRDEEDLHRALQMTRGLRRLRTGRRAIISLAQSWLLHCA